MRNVIDNKQFPGGTVTTLALRGGAASDRVQVGFSGRATGVVTVTARGTGATLFDAIANGDVNLATTGTLLIDGSVEELKFADAGSGAYTVSAISRI